jgi:hypothetical protein
MSEGILQNKWSIGGTIYEFTYPVSREWAVKYLREREGIEISKRDAK